MIVLYILTAEQKNVGRIELANRLKNNLNTIEKYEAIERIAQTLYDNEMM